MNKVVNFIKDIIRIANKLSFICAVLVLVLLILSPTPITGFCFGWCLGIFTIDTMHKYINDKYK